MKDEKAVKDENVVKEATVQEKMAAQVSYATDNNHPLFAPATGMCFRCSKNVYTGITFEAASSELITGCPFCCMSFCD